MDAALWVLAVYVGIGVAWLVAMLILARTQYETVFLKEALIHLFAWPFVLVELRLWWIGFVAATVAGTAVFLAFRDRGLRYESLLSMWASLQ